MSCSKHSNGSERKRGIWLCVAAAVVMLEIAGLATSPPCQAQAGQNGKAQAAKLTSQQLVEIAKAQLLQHGTEGPKLSNPIAASANASMIAVLEKQKQMADVELREILSTTSATAPRSIDSQVSTTAATGSGKSAGAPGANASNPRSLPPPLGTSSSSVAAQHPAGADHLQVAIPCRRPFISSVNGQASGAIFTPGAAWNLYTIKGCGFGSKPGDIYLEGPFTSGRIQLLFPSPKDWSDTAIIAQLNPQLGGESDHDNVALVIEPQGIAPLRTSGFRFYAARETTLLPTIPQHVVQFAGPPFSSAQHIPADNSDLKQGFYASYVTPSRKTPPASVDVNRECWLCVPNLIPSSLVPGSDYYDFSSLSPGFHPDSMQLAYASDAFSIGQTSLPSCPSSGDWKAQWDGNNIRVSWKVLDCGSWSGDLKMSSYSLSVWVTGPRDVNPWLTVAGVHPKATVKPHP